VVVVVVVRMVAEHLFLTPHFAHFTCDNRKTMVVVHIHRRFLTTIDTIHDVAIRATRE
jgi:hypothetical protein